MGIQQNYLYRVMPDLAEKGQVTKSGRGWHLRQRKRCHLNPTGESSGEDSPSSL